MTGRKLVPGGAVIQFSLQLGKLTGELLLNGRQASSVEAYLRQA